MASIRARLIAAWGGRARIRRNLLIAVSDGIGLTVAFQFAFPEVGVENSAIFSGITRLLTGLAVWMASHAMLRFTGEQPRDEADTDSTG